LGRLPLTPFPYTTLFRSELVQKALSAMLRTGERFGVEHLIAVLRGEATDRVRQMGHDGVRTFGAGAELEAGPWRGVFRQLYALGDRKSTRLNSSHVKISY